MDRRLFLRSLGVTAGALFIPDRFLLRAERYFENEGYPLLRTYRNPVYTILADECGDLHIGDPFKGPDRFPSWKEFLTECWGHKPEDLTDEFLDQWNLCSADVDREVEQEYYWSWWLRHESSGAHAYNFLYPLDVGPEIHKDGEIVGRLTFFDGPFPGSDCLISQIDDHYSLPFLQWRLERLGQPCNFEVRR